MGNYFKHKIHIAQGTHGEFDKISEEYLELADAFTQKKKVFSILEAADLVAVTGEFTWRQFKVPLILIVILCYLRKPYKLVRNFYMRTMYGPRIMGL